MVRLFFVFAVLSVSAFPLIYLPSESSAHKRIISGEKAGEKTFPKIVALVSRGSSRSYLGQFCGGVLIKPRWVLTAGHCVSKKSYKNTDIVAGRLNLSKKEGARIAVSAVRIHPHFDRKRNSHDFALLYLAKSWKGRGQVLFPEKRFKTPRKLWVAGWGMTEYDTFSSELLETSVHSVSDRVCQGAYRGKIDHSMVCAFRRGRDSCFGDSGGPLFGKHGKRRILYGIVSWGNGCAKKGFPGVYSKISHVTRWIKQIAKEKPRVKKQKAGREIFPSIIVKNQGPLDSVELRGPYLNDNYDDIYNNYYSEIYFWERFQFPLEKIVLRFRGSGNLCAPEMSDACNLKKWVLGEEIQWYFSFYTEKKCFSYKARIFPKKARSFLYQDSSCSRNV